MRLPVIQAITEFEGAMDAVFDLMSFHHDNLPRDSRRDYFKKVVRQWNPSDSDETIDAIFDAADQAVSASAPGNVFQEVRNRVRSKLEELSVDAPGYGTLYYRDVTAALTQRSRQAKMREALLTSAVGAFDVLMSEIMLAAACVKPSAMYESKKPYKLCDIAKFASLDDLILSHAEKFVRDKAYEGVTEWFEWLNKAVDIPLSKVTDHPLTFQEVFLRRNNIVHAGGLVNETYLTRLPEGIVHRPKLNDRLRVNRKYLQGACELILAVGYAAFAHFVTYYEGNQEEPADVDGLIANHSYRLLERSHDSAVDEYVRCVEAVCSDQDYRRVMMVNRWVALKRAGKKVFRDEVTEWDVTRLPRRFELARRVLLDEYDAAIDLANDLVARNELMIEDWHTWPLLDSLRKYVALYPEKCKFV
ncbi:hypothetical protein [Williamsia herbipolensis]|uniref:hypothetical protein n=1 Tax=Williamsia herbipolensis TaxID=1603258 RepID=UPI0005F88D16|nr:hypothetical protein [Williamsia herbipolensis]